MYEVALPPYILEICKVYKAHSFDQIKLRENEKRLNIRHTSSQRITILLPLPRRKDIIIAICDKKLEEQVYLKLITISAIYKYHNKAWPQSVIKKMIVDSTLNR